MASSSAIFLFESGLVNFGGGDGLREGAGEGEGEGVASSSASGAGRFEFDAATSADGEGEADAVSSSLSSSSLCVFFLDTGFGFVLVALRGSHGGADAVAACFLVTRPFALGEGEGDAEAVASLSCTSWPPPRKLAFLVLVAGCLLRPEFVA